MVSMRGHIGRRCLPMNRKLIDNCMKIIDYLSNAPEMERTVNDISYSTKLSYIQIRNCIKTHFPQCFEQNSFNGWNFTGEPLLLEPLVVWEPKPVEVTAPRQGPTGSGWQWRKQFLDDLSALFGKPIEDVLKDFHQAGKLAELSGIGKTLARAADQMQKTGRIPF